MLLFVCCVWVFLQARPVLLECDRSMNSDIKEGNIGEVDLFSWIGVLRTKIFTATESKVALTGIVMVRDRYCIGYADDVAKINKRNLEDTTRAMFIPTNEKPWYSKVKDYMMHPEYDYATMNTIALIELDLEYVTHCPVTPICWTPKNFNTTDLYVIGYTDENKLLEKVIYKVDYVSQEVCKEFYERQQPLVVERLEERNKLCSVAQSNKKHCEWDNGMVMASNSTGFWTLIGFSLQGPSCSAPSRFIDLTKYLNWIEMSSTLEPEEIYRKSGGDTEFHEKSLSKGTRNEQFGKSGDNTDYNYPNKNSKVNAFEKLEDVTKFDDDNHTSIGFHDNDFLKPGDLTRFNEDNSSKEPNERVTKPVDDTEFYQDQTSEEPNTYRKLRDDTEFYKDNISKGLKNDFIRNREDISNKVNDNMNNSYYFRVRRLARNAISINFNNIKMESGDCTISKAIVYSESMPLRSNKTNLSTVLIKIPVIDLMYKDYNCIALEVKPMTKSARLWYNITRKNTNQLKLNKKAITDKISTQHRRKHHINIIDHPIDVLNLKIKFIFAADFVYLVYGKEKITNAKKDKLSKNKFKENKNKVVKVSVKTMPIKKITPRLENNKSRSQIELAKRNVNIDDNNRNFNQTLQTIDQESKEAYTPVALHYITNNIKQDGFFNSIKSVMLGMYKNYMTVNVFLTLSIIFAIVYMLFSVFVRKGYVRL